MITKKLFPLLVLFNALACSPAWSEEVSLAGLIARIEGPQPAGSGAGELELGALMQKHNVPGLTVAVIKDFKLHWTKAYGLADAESATPAGDTTLFQAASISKPLTAMAVLRLAQQGKLDLDADINTALK